MNIIAFVDRMKDYFAWTDIRNPNADYKSFLSLRNVTEFRDNIYVCDPICDLNVTVFPECCLFLYSSEDDTFPIIPNRMMLKKEISIKELFFQLEKLFWEDRSWKDKLKESLLREEGIEKLLQISIPVFQNPIFLMNMEYRIQFLVNVPGGIALEERYGTEMRNNEIVGERMMRQLRSSKRYMDTMYGESATIWKDEKWKGSFLNVNLYSDNDQAFGCLLISDCNRPFLSGDAYQLEYLAKLIKYSIRHRNYYSSDSMENIKHLLQTSIHAGAFPDETAAIRFSQYCGFQKKQLLKYVVIIPSSQEVKRKMLVYHCSQLETLFPSAKAFEIENRIILIMSHNKEMSISKFMYYESLLREYLQKNLLIGSMSQEFTDINNLPLYHKQVMSIYESGIAMKVEEALFTFDKLALPYMLFHARGNLDINLLIPDGLRRLIQYDQENNSNYCKLLRIYLENNCSISSSIKILYMHRNTFLYQLEKVKTILGIDLHNPNNRLQLILVLRLLKK